MNEVSLRSILCPVDFSEQSRHALRLAQAIAQRNQSRVTVVSAIDPLLAEAAKSRLGLDLAKSDTEPALREFVAATSHDGTAWLASGSVDVKVGKAEDVILDAASRTSADLIVMGTHGLGGIRKWVLGSTTERVLRRTPVAVLAVPPPVASAAPTAPSPAQEAGPVLMATDFSETAARALRWAASLARESGSPLLIVHVIEPIVVASRWEAYVERPSEARLAEARTQLQELAKQSAAAPSSQCLVEVGRPADTIASVAEARRAGMIVMGLVSGPGTLGARPGSIAYRVLCLAPTPVLVVPPQEAVQSSQPQ